MLHGGDGIQKLASPVSIVQHINILIQSYDLLFSSITYNMFIIGMEVLKAFYFSLLFWSEYNSCFAYHCLPWLCFILFCSINFLIDKLFRDKVDAGTTR